MEPIQHILSVQDQLGEGPLWDPACGLLYWLDIESNLYHTLNPVTNAHEIVSFKNQCVGVMAQRTAGGMVTAGSNGFGFWDPDTQTWSPIVDPEAHKPQSRFNDGAVDRRGRFWAGTLGDADQNGLYCLNPDLSLRQMESGISVSNGIGWSPDNRVMYYTDSGPAVIYAYDFDLESGNLSNRRVFVGNTRPGTPDGLTVDCEGFIWSTRWDGWCVDRYDPDGKLERTIPMPVQRPTSVMFGDANLERLYITSARTELSPSDLAAQPLAGDLFACYPGVKGLPEPRFAG